MCDKIVSNGRESNSGAERRTDARYIPGNLHLLSPWEEVTLGNVLRVECFDDQLSDQNQVQYVKNAIG